MYGLYHDTCTFFIRQAFIHRSPGHRKSQRFQVSDDAAASATADGRTAPNKDVSTETGEKGGWAQNEAEDSSPKDIECSKAKSVIVDFGEPGRSTKETKGRDGSHMLHL